MLKVFKKKIKNMKYEMAINTYLLTITLNASELIAAIKRHMEAEY